MDTATFQHNPEYTPSYPWGRVLAIIETLVTSTLSGLFLLAIRRQFRRQSSEGFLNLDTKLGILKIS